MLIYGLLFTLGGLMGSFFTVVAERLPQGQSIITPRSHCTACKHPLGPAQLVPILAYLWLKGRCYYCQATFSKLSFIVEVLSAHLTVAFYYLVGGNFSLIPISLLVISALLLSLTDILYFVVEPHIFYFFTFLTIISSLLIPSAVGSHLTAALLVWTLLTLLTHWRPDTLGGGDIKLLTAWTFLLGYFAIALIILLASTAALILISVSKKRVALKERIPFVPFLSFGLIAYLFYTLIV